MLESLLILVALLGSPVVVADASARDVDDGSEKDLCNDLGRDPYRCSLRSDLCFWDTSDQRCEWVADPSFCAGLKPYVCNQVPNCFYDTSDQRCERLQ